ncbi:hypothetical protein [Kordia sp.]|uniref:hypothetical protein n=1 Tax=Kordia sp. TaxID=1965332 RepID=UPI0025BD57ED|nr:hypothetical protein [Kordia sp.]MCH2195046.1 hypothetical protein [Kordia sp.]
MKSILSTKIVALLLFVSLCSFKCKTDDVIEINPEDLAAPEITIITPNENATFYTDGGMDSPDYLILQANATDASTIIRGSVTVKNSAGAEVYYYEETAATQNNATITTIYTSFRTSEPGTYSLIYEFEDSNENVSQVSIVATCIFSETDPYSDEPS